MAVNVLRLAGTVYFALHGNACHCVVRRLEQGWISPVRQQVWEVIIAVPGVQFSGYTSLISRK